MNRSQDFLVKTARALLPALGLLAVWFLLFEVFRLLLMLATWSFRADATGSELWASFWHGARFDLSAAAKLVLVFGLWQIWRANPVKWERRLAFVLHSVVAFLCIFALISEIEFYKEFQMRLGPLALEYFSTKSEHNKIILGMIWHGYPVVRWMLVCLALWLGFAWVSRRMLTARTVPESESSWPKQSCATVLWIALSVVAIRGGFQQSVLRWGDAFFCQSTYANHMAENGVFALIDTLRNLGRGSKLAANWKRSIPQADAIAVTQKVTLLPGEKLVDPERYPLLRISPGAEITRNRRPRNVVLVIMESFTARFCGATGASFGATPNFDDLARGGILFDRAFSVGTHTAQGVFGTLCSFPNLPEYEALMKHPMGRQPFRSLPAVLGEAGYQTLFLYNGLFSWDNKEGFFRNHGMQRFIGREDYENPVFVDPDWGVSDLDVFQRALAEFDTMSRTNRPFLGVILTLSNHSPFNLPRVEGLEAIQGGGEQNQRLNGVHYADWALGQFMAQARTRGWFEDTLFVFVGDHGFGIPPSLTEVSILHMHVPLLFYAPALLGDQHEVRHQVAGQLDILPSILGLLGLELPHQSFGRDLFRLPPDDPGHACVKRSGNQSVGWIEGDQIAIAAIGRPTTLHTFDLGFPPSATADLAAENSVAAKEMARHLKAFVATGIWTVQKRLAAPALNEQPALKPLASRSGAVVTGDVGRLPQDSSE